MNVRDFAFIFIPLSFRQFIVPRHSAEDPKVKERDRKYKQEYNKREYVKSRKRDNNDIQYPQAQVIIQTTVECKTFRMTAMFMTCNMHSLNFKLHIFMMRYMKHTFCV